MLFNNNKKCPLFSCDIALCITDGVSLYNRGEREKQLAWLGKRKRRESLSNFSLFVIKSTTCLLLRKRKKKKSKDRVSIFLQESYFSRLHFYFVRWRIHMCLTSFVFFGYWGGRWTGNLLLLISIGFLLQTWQRETLDLRSCILRVWGSGVLNIFWGGITANQKLYAVVYELHLPCPWHSIKGLGRKSSKQDPGDERGCPLPSAPASVFITKLYPTHNPSQFLGQSGI